MVEPTRTGPKAGILREGDALLTIGEVAAMPRVPVATLRYWRHMSIGPNSFRLGRGVRYWHSDVATWLNNLSNGHGLDVATWPRQTAAHGVPSTQLVQVGVVDRLLVNQLRFAPEVRALALSQSPGKAREVSKWPATAWPAGPMPLARRLGIADEMGPRAPSTSTEAGRRTLGSSPSGRQDLWRRADRSEPWRGHRRGVRRGWLAWKVSSVILTRFDVRRRAEEPGPA